ncbi:MAG: sigma-54 dependent transcriptional regulator [Desulfobacterales bacterium]|nr:sigma-54 dependent transcriptional regulator [Desulfobacterales bacterium]
MIDQNLFFRNATLKISSSLNIEKALWHCLWYLQEIIPVGQICIHLFDEKTGIAEAIAHATLEDYRAMSVKTRMPRESLRHIEAQRSLRIRNVANTNHNPVTAPLCRPLGCSGLAALVMDLVIEAKFLGVVSFISLPDEVFTREHKELVAQLNEPFAIAVTNSIRYREIQRYKEQLEDDNKYLHRRLSRLGGESVVGSDFGLKGVMELVRQVAPIDSPVLLLGETGVGKEVIARTIHNLSDRGEGPFIDVNCGAIPESLMDSELFGHEKGSFTGAVAKKRGLFERAQGGTIFLDEIGELNPNAQVRLLRVLQEKRLERVGGNETIELDIRVVAATHRNLEAMMKTNAFRQDLYFRLNVFPILIPPLRERKSDIPSLVQHFLQKKSTQLNYTFPHHLTAGAMDRLTAYDWPGNVRELEHAVERALILSNGNPMSFREILPGPGDEPGPASKAPAPPDSSDLEPDMNLDAAMARHIRRALFQTRGKINGETGAAKLLGINPHTLRHRLRKLDIPFGKAAKTTYGTSDSVK